MIFSWQTLNKIHQQIDTPALLIHAAQMEKNRQAMQAVADKNNCTVRPHIKTHKSIRLAKKQLELGAAGITAAKTSEAEVMADAGIDNIFIANQVTHPLKIKRLFKLHRRAEIIIGLDHIKQIELLKPVFGGEQKPLKVRIEIDSGLQRCGLQIGNDLLYLAKEIINTAWIKLEGIFTHAGQVYAASSLQEIEEVGLLEGRIMADAKDFLQENGISINSVSTGSSPTAPFSVQNKAVTEIRPGNYIFYDAMQTALGSATKEQCAIYVLATVTSQPAPDRIVMDAGSKALNLDQTSGKSGHGLAVNINGKIIRVSEEHGVIKLHQPQQVEIGSPVLIIPNHACTAVNLFDYFHLIENENIERIAVSARGKSQ